MVKARTTALLGICLVLVVTGLLLAGWLAVSGLRDVSYGTPGAHVICTDMEVFTNESLARCAFASASAAAPVRAQLLPPDLWPESHYPQGAAEDREFLLDLGRLVRTGTAGGSLTSAKGGFWIKQVYELVGGDLLLHGYCSGQIAAAGPEGATSITLYTVRPRFRSPRAVFFLRVSPDGQPMWLTGISPFLDESTGSYEISVSERGAITMVASYVGSVRIGVGGARTCALGGFLDAGVFAAHFAENGALQWCHRTGGGLAVFHALTPVGDDGSWWLLGKVMDNGEGSYRLVLAGESDGHAVPAGRWFVASFGMDE